MSSFPIQSSVVLARLKPFGISMEKSLSDLIKGIRAHSKESPESLLEFLNDAVNECRDELNTTDHEVKATAILKLTYLEMYGFDMSWCNFHILEIMSSTKFQQKRIGYLAAMQSLKNEPELLILATNQFKKDLGSHNHVDVGLALSGIATIVSPPLAKDILDDVVMKLSHSKPYIRKKAVLALFKVFLQYPDSLRSTLPRVIEKLDDPDVAVVSSTITIICEISKKNPNIFVSYLPKFFSILEDTSNNWLIIRILKLFQSLSKIEPRMKKRIMPSIMNLLGKTEATSLVYECINCVVNGAMISAGSSKDKEVAKICIDHLMKFFETGDSNLKFVGLLALIKIVEIFPSFIYKMKGVSNIVMDCLTDGDLIIKRKALEICHYLATEDNMSHLVKTLLMQLVPNSHLAVIEDGLKLEITKKILQIASADNYANIPNFKWYVTALKELANLTLLSNSNKFNKSNTTSLSKGILTTIALLLGREFKSVSTKVPSIRPFILNKVITEFTTNALPLEVSPLLMKSIYWIMGEYVNNYGFTDEDGADCDDDVNTTLALGQKVSIFNNLVNCYVDENLNQGQHFLVSQKIIQSLEPEVLTVLIDAVVKLFCGILSDYKCLYMQNDKMTKRKVSELGYFLLKLVSFLEHWQNNTSFEVQERCLSWLEYLRLCYDALDVESGILVVKSEEMAYYSEKFLQTTNQESDDSQDSSGADDIDDSSEEEYSDSDNDSDKESEDNSLELTKNVTDGNVPQAESDSAPTSGFDDQLMSVPSILSEVLPSLFQSYQLNPISATAQSHISIPDDLDLDTQINDLPSYCFQDSDISTDDDSLSDEDVRRSRDQTPDESAQREREERLKDDPYYISGSSKSKGGKSKQRLLQFDDDTSRSESMSPANLDSFSNIAKSINGAKKPKKLKKEKVVILLEETLGGNVETNITSPTGEKKKKKKNKLIIDSFGLENLNIESPGASDVKDYEYDIDLDTMRQTLKQKAQKNIKKIKKNKRSEKHSTKSNEITLTEAVPKLDPISVDTEGQDDTRITSTPITVASSTKTKKKKKKAVIAD